MKTICLVVCSVCCAAVCLQAEDKIQPGRLSSSGHTTDPVSVVHERIKAGQAVLLDVRERSEWNAGHLKLARLVPLSQLRSGQLTDKQRKILVKDKPLYCHCRSGGRVLIAARILKAQGYDIRPLKYGYDALLKAGFEKAAPPESSTEDPPQPPAKQ